MTKEFSPTKWTFGTKNANNSSSSFIVKRHLDQKIKKYFDGSQQFMYNLFLIQLGVHINITYNREDVKLILENGHKRLERFDEFSHIQNKHKTHSCTYFYK